MLSFPDALSVMSEKGGSAGSASFTGSPLPAGVASGFCSKAYKKPSYAQSVIIVIIDLSQQK